MDSGSAERRTSPLGLGPRGLLPNLYDLIVFILVAATFVALAHGARQMSASLTTLDIAPVTLQMDTANHHRPAGMRSGRHLPGI